MNKYPTGVNSNLLKLPVDDYHATDSLQQQRPGFVLKTI